MSRAYAEVIGDPISHSKSPLIHGFWLQKLGIAADYRACHVRPGDLGDYIAARRTDSDWRGCNATIPHKEAVISHLDRLDAKAAAIGAVNTVLRGADGTLTGTNTDVDGAGEAVAGVDICGRHAVVIGAGGAARAAFALLAAKDCASVRALARTPQKAVDAAAGSGLAIDARLFVAGSGAFDGAALVINATQLGMTGQEPMPGFVLDELTVLAPDALVFDMVYAPLETALLRGARGRGLKTSDGLVMLIGQAATAFEKFFGVAPPREHDAELRGKLTS
jgi:shikimate dehydrogenase